MEPETPQPAKPEAPIQAPKEQRHHLTMVLGLSRDLLVSVVLAIVIILFLYQPVKVEGTSMMPLLEDQQRIFINKFLYQWNISRIERSDLVVFYYPGDTSKSYIKRVIGIPGDTVEVRAGDVFVNGSKMVEPYVPPEFHDQISYPRSVVPAKQYFVMGDHRISSNDSRAWGYVPRDHIYGKAVFVYWPLDRAGIIR